MNKSDFVSAVASTAELSKTDAGNAVDAVIEVIKKALKKGDSVSLVGFGSFVAVSRAAGTARNPRTGETVARPASKTARFRVGEGLKSALNG